MTTAEFKNGIINWLHKNNIDTVYDIEFSNFPYYDLDEHCVYIGLKEVNDCNEWFEEFLLNNGLEWKAIIPPVLQFLHEVGHSMTVYKYSDIDLILFDLMKSERMDNKEAAVAYWSTEDEFVANKWLINFINNNIEAAEELCQFFIDNWNSMIEEMED